MECLCCIFIYSSHRVDYIQPKSQPIVFCQKPLKKMFCIQKNKLAENMPKAKTVLDNAVSDGYTSATECIQYCKTNERSVSNFNIA